MSTGVFEGLRFELIDGDLIDKMGQNPPHAFAISLVMEWLLTFLRGNQIRVQLPVEMLNGDKERSLPEPDLAVISERKPEFRQRHPRGDELLLVVEVADSSAAFDLSRKAALYAASNVPEYWVLDLARRMLVIHRQADGTQYRQIQMYGEGDSVSMAGRSETTPVSDLLPTQ
jgi:Uma2 family endonuclease